MFINDLNNYFSSSSTRNQIESKKKFIIVVNKIHEYRWNKKIQHHPMHHDVPFLSTTARTRCKVNRSGVPLLVWSFFYLSDSLATGCIHRKWVLAENYNKFYLSYVENVPLQRGRQKTWVRVHKYVPGNKRNIVIREIVKLIQNH